MEIYFTSDLHLGHENIIAGCGRNVETCGKDFANVEEMNDFLIERWNKKVQEEDIVYILGDLSFRSKVPVRNYLCQLKGRKQLILGNHDPQWTKSINDMSEFFESVSDLKVIKLNKKQITLCHYPMLEWNGSRRSHDQETALSWLIHGHIHNDRNVTYEYIRDHQPCALNCGVDINNFEPVTFDELLENNNRWYGRKKNEM